jgi:hypothetical protein
LCVRSLTPKRTIHCRGTFFTFSIHFVKRSAHNPKNGPVSACFDERSTNRCSQASGICGGFRLTTLLAFFTQNVAA